MRFLLRVVGVFIIIWAGLSIVRRLLPAPAGPSARHLVKDPVCGTYIPEATALKQDNQFFCSEACRRAFAANS